MKQKYDIWLNRFDADILSLYFICPTSDLTLKDLQFVFPEYSLNYYGQRVWFFHLFGILQCSEEHGFRLTEFGKHIRDKIDEEGYVYMGELELTEPPY